MLIYITGASRGLGRAMTEGFVERGHTVVGCARNGAGVRELAGRFGKPHRFDVVDVTDAAAVQGWAESALASHGPPDLLVNNAAVINPPTRLWEVGPEEFTRLIDVNVNGVFHVCRAVLPAMVAREQGVVVNFSSGWGRSTSPEVAPYCASKYAVEGLTLALAQELPAGMAAVPLNPGIIDTDMLRQAFGESAGAYPEPAAWARRAVPFLLGLSAKDNGRSLNVPGEE